MRGLVGELGVTGARPGRQRGYGNLVEYLVGREGRGQQVDEEVVDTQRAVLAGAAGDETRVEGYRHRGQVARRVGVGKAAADGAHVAHLRIGHRGRRLGQHGRPRRHQVRRLKLGVGGHRAYGKAAVLFANVGHVAYSAQVDDNLRLGQAQLHQRNEAVAAGQQLGVLTVLFQQFDRLGDRRGGEVLEGAGNHLHLLSGVQAVILDLCVALPWVAAKAGTTKRSRDWRWRWRAALGERTGAGGGASGPLGYPMFAAACCTALTMLW